MLAFVLLLLVKPFMLRLTFARMLGWDLASNVTVYTVFFIFAVAVGILAGLFPAVVLSGLQPVKVLKNLSNVKLFSRMGLRKALLVSQFTLSLIFILTVIVMYNQLALFMHTDYGFNMNNNMMIRLNHTSPKALKSELLKYPGIENVAATSHIPASGTTYGDGFKRDLSEKEWSNMNYFSVDEDYLKNMEVSLVAGTFFDPQNGESNKNFIVINEEAVKVLHYKTAKDALGEEILCQRDSSRKVIIGIVKNYNHEQLMSRIGPLALMYQPDQISLLQVRYSGTYTDAVRTIEKAWAVVNPNLKIDYKKVEAEIKLFYNTVFGDLVIVLGVIASLAIIISCLGLLGMATYMMETRMKEIAMRKVLGSTNRALMLLLSKGFMKMIMISILIGVPAAWFLNNAWLTLVAYHTQLSFDAILLGVLILLLFAGVTVGSQTWRAALTNPVDSLKGE
jgi:putative ABC transport system permease protein